MSAGLLFSCLLKRTSSKNAYISKAVCNPHKNSTPTSCMISLSTKCDRPEYHMYEYCVVGVLPNLQIHFSHA
jgi:hypothetical protein